MGADWGEPDAEDVWNEVRRLSPVHAGMSYARLEELGGLQWPCYDENHPGELFLHSRLWEDPVPGNRVPFVPVDHDPPVDRSTTTSRSGSRPAGGSTPTTRASRPPATPRRCGAARASTSAPRTPRVRPRRRRARPGRLAARPGRGRRSGSTPSLRPGLTFMTMHFQDEVAVNLLTIDATDPKSGTAEFKATAIRIEKLGEEKLAEASPSERRRRPRAADSAWVRSP